MKLAKLINPEYYAREKYRFKTKCKDTLIFVLRWIFLICIAYVILGPIITVVSNSFMSIKEVYNPLIYLIPMNPTLDNIKIAVEKLNYLPVIYKTFSFVLLLMIIQTLICSLVGYGFARFDFPFKKILFGGVILTIIVPIHTIMVPLYTQFRYFDIFGIISLFNGGQPINLLNTKAPIILMTITGMGLRSGLYIYIFRQFFRGLPKEIEEAALIDGAGAIKIFFRIMLPNAVPAIVIVALFSLVWQYNDTFMTSLFMSNAEMISLRLPNVAGSLAQIERITDPRHVELITNSAVLLTILPVIVIYLILQRFFMEGVERSGIVG
ncbi:UNVERIFIED_CONTAM: multiple sugar transport system permease protein [Acetivibrio alkalicellulosi]